MSSAADDVGPIPPPQLAGYVVGLEASDEVVRAYRDVGAHLHGVIVETLGDRWPKGDARALDFGCGSGRVLRHFAQRVDPGQLYGSDIDDACVAWVREHLPAVEATVNGARPPLPYADGSFDVVWSVSVFTQLTDAWAEWLLELRRVLRPGGRLLLTVMGEPFSQPIASEPWDPDRIGMTVRGSGRPWSAGGPMVLHSEWWIRAHWGRAFDVVDFTPQRANGQDVVVLERPDTEPPTADELRAPQPGETRELAAALHAVELAHREYAELNSSHDAYARAYQAEAATTAALRSEVERLARLPRRLGLIGELRRLARRRP